MGKPNRMYIHRIAARPFPHWQLRFRYHSKLIHSQVFADRRYGGSKEKALEAALAKRDKIAHSLGIDLEKHWHDCRTKKYRYTQRAGKRNKTGIVGVQFTVMGGHRYYKACICLERYKETVKSFSCDLLGDDEALRLAVEQRKEWVRELRGDAESDDDLKK